VEDLGNSMVSWLGDVQVDSRVFRIETFARIEAIMLAACLIQHTKGINLNLVLFPVPDRYRLPAKLK